MLIPFVLQLESFRFVDFRQCTMSMKFLATTTLGDSAEPQPNNRAGRQCISADIFPPHPAR